MVLVLAQVFCATRRRDRKWKEKVPQIAVRAVTGRENTGQTKLITGESIACTHTTTSCHGECSVAITCSTSSCVRSPSAEKASQLGRCDPRYNSAATAFARDSQIAGSFDFAAVYKSLCHKKCRHVILDVNYCKRVNPNMKSCNKCVHYTHSLAKLSLPELKMPTFKANSQTA